jgi:hypothetical protein
MRGFNTLFGTMATFLPESSCVTYQLGLAVQHRVLGKSHSQAGKYQLPRGVLAAQENILREV